MSVKFEKVTFNEKATGGGDTPGEVKNKTNRNQIITPGLMLCILSFVLKV